MFSQLGPLFKTTLRQAEQTDTRLQIRKDDREQQGKHQEFADAEADTDGLWTDSAEVSVASLKAFLLEFLPSRGVAVETPSSFTASDSMPVMSLQPATDRAARAIKAYTSTQSQSAETPPAPPILEASAPEPELVEGVDSVQAEEVRAMYRLIHDLEILDRRGIHTLVIDKADSFVESLVQAVRLANLTP